MVDGYIELKENGGKLIEIYNIQFRTYLFSDFTGQKDGILQGDITNKLLIDYFTMSGGFMNINLLSLKEDNSVFYLESAYLKEWEMEYIRFKLSFDRFTRLSDTDAKHTIRKYKLKQL